MFERKCKLLLLHRQAGSGSCVQTSCTEGVNVFVTKGERDWRMKLEIKLWIREPVFVWQENWQNTKGGTWWRTKSNQSVYPHVYVCILSVCRVRRVSVDRNEITLPRKPVSLCEEGAGKCTHNFTLSLTFTPENSRFASLMPVDRLCGFWGFQSIDQNRVRIVDGLVSTLSTVDFVSLVDSWHATVTRKECFGERKKGNCL